MSTPTYGGIHRRLKATRGPARGLPCVDCGRAAAVWRCRCSDSSVVVGTNSSGRRVTYSTDLAEYDPACWRHANAYDAERTRDRRATAHLALTPTPKPPRRRQALTSSPPVAAPALEPLFDLDPERRPR